MAGENENNGGKSGEDFIPNAEFNAAFANVEISGTEEEGGGENNQNQNNNENESPEDKAARLEAEKSAGGNAAEIEAAKQKVIDDKAAADKLLAAEEEKISKMSPTEKEAYLAEKNKGANGAANNQQQNETPKPFSEELLSHFDGKFKTVEEIKAKLDAPPVEVFADDTIKHLNDYVKAGGKIDAQYLQEITTDYKAIGDGVELAMRHLQTTDPRFKNADADELEFEVRKRYDMDNWSEDGAEEMNETRRIMSKRLEREAEEFRSELIKKQDSLKFIKPVDPQVELNATEARKANIKEWQDKIVPEIVAQIPKLSTVLTDKDGKPLKDAFDYVPEKADKDEVVRIANSLAENAKGFWDQYVGKDGKFDHKRLITAMFRDRSYDKAVQLAREQGRAGGYEEGIKSIKGIDFNTDKGRNNGEGNELSFDQAAAKSLSEHL